MKPAPLTALALALALLAGCGDDDHTCPCRDAMQAYHACLDDEGRNVDDCSPLADDATWLCLGVGRD